MKLLKERVRAMVGTFSPLHTAAKLEHWHKFLFPQSFKTSGPLYKINANYQFLFI